MPIQKISTLILMGFFFLFALAARAESPSSPSALTFKTWKEQQILTAQNRLLRLSAEWEQAKASVPSKEEESVKASPKEKALQRFHRAQEKSGMERMEKEVKLAREAVKSASELTLDDYIAIYLPSLSQTPESIQTLVESMSREEITKILTEILKKQSNQRDKAHAGSRLTELWAGEPSPNH